MQLCFPDVVSAEIYKYGFFDDRLTCVILKNLRPGGTFFDVGAHFGYFTLLASSLVGSSGAVHSFEPTDGSFRMLSENASSNRNIRANQLAMWSRDATVNLRDFGIGLAAFNPVFQPRLEPAFEQTSRALPRQVGFSPLVHRPDRRSLPRVLSPISLLATPDALLVCDPTCAPAYQDVRIPTGIC